MTLYTNSRLTIFNLAELLGISEGNIRKRVERNRLPEPVERNPHMTWDATTFWDWYNATQPKGYSPDLVPISYWPSDETPTPRVSYKRNQIEVTYRHKMGVITLIYPAGVWPAEQIEGRIEAVVRGTLSPSGFDVDVRRPGVNVREDTTATATLSRIVSQDLPYWPFSLRFPSARGDVQASRAETASAFATIQRLTPLIEDAGLRNLLDQHAQALAYGAYCDAEASLKDVEEGVFPGEPFKHLAIQARPLPVPEIEMPDWQGEAFRVVGDSPVVTVALERARNSWGAMLAGIRSIRSLDAASDAARDFFSALVPVPSDSVTLGHHFIMEGDSLEAFIHPRYSDILVTRSGDRLDYLPPRKVGPVGEDALLDLTDASNPFIRHENDWLPLAYNPHYGTEAGYDGTGPKVLVGVIASALTGKSATRDLREAYRFAGSILERADYPRRVTVDEVLSTVGQRG